MIAENKLGLVQITFVDYAFALLDPLRTIRYIYSDVALICSFLVNNMSERSCCCLHLLWSGSHANGMGTAAFHMINCSCCLHKK